jgi:hypothetical protein
MLGGVGAKVARSRIGIGAVFCVMALAAVGSFSLVMLLASNSRCEGGDDDGGAGPGPLRTKERAADALLLLTEIVARREGPPPTVAHVNAARRLVALLDAGGRGGRGLGSMTAPVRALALSVLERAGEAVDDSGDGAAAGVGGGGGAARGATAADRATAMPADPDAQRRAANRLFSQQTCYVNTDEAEICVFDNLLCFDGRSPVVTVDTPVREPERIMDYTHSCAWHALRAGPGYA